MYLHNIFVLLLILAIGNYKHIGMSNEKYYGNSSGYKIKGVRMVRPGMFRPGMIRPMIFRPGMIRPSG